MLNSLENLFAKCGALVFGFGIAFLILSLVIPQIQSRFALAIACLGIAFSAASFVMFYANVRGYQNRIDQIAEQSVDTSRLNTFTEICWVFFIALPFGVLALKLIGIADGENFYDFGAYYNAGERVVNGYPLYDWTTTYPSVTELPDSPDRYLYAPLISLLFVPFTYLPYRISAIAWTTLSVSIYLTGISVFLQSLNDDISLKNWLIIWTGSLGFGPFVVTFISGQVTAIVTGLLCLAAAGLHRENQTASFTGEAILAVPVTIKAYYAPVGAPLLRDKRRLLVAATAVAGVMIGGLFVFGVDTTINYFRVLSEGKGWGEATDPPSMWNINDFHPFYYLGSLGYVFRAVILSTIIVISYRSRNHDFEYVDEYIFSLGILGVVLGAPTLATPGLVLTVPVILFLIVTTYRERPVVLVSVLISALLIHAHPYTNELVNSIIVPNLGVSTLASGMIPAIQPAVWGTLVLAACLSYEYNRKIELSKR